ncbi:RNA polymerase III-inhibiting protein MAF1 NDAI_0A06540 [Naumovozyma dairenensis CBS 421]|uniref:Repressor of RNA polymerase III transcription MAF1 n=1 Tax=Naumovozyma dairenensis (strain ATCC 10597 / BCRC 20456 / CBS 421 / NBRC 0211 / NRRL Y-12639) TaxID=1071378 RepID=G0W4S0_NAUDC|nr:hypothetical protein NDAI_0A06540 [Naumovozyma dairenensis CBS 421]CCD22808.1 hypothetical protein NDAI_0A06540 [Naumovozyma dairenensis CBS 421]
MKFIDELDIEKVNQSLNFETNDCKITGGCDIFTTKPVASDKKLYKTIDHHLETILQENESYKAAIQQQILMEANKSISPSPFNQTSNDASSFWEQKRRMSVGDSFHNNHYYTNSNNSTNNPNNNSTNNVNNNTVSFWEENVATPPIIRSSKLNDQNLKELVMESNSGYGSSTSITSSKSSSSLYNSMNKRNDSNRDESTTNGINNDNNSTEDGEKKKKIRRRSSLNDTSSNITIGPFGPIKEPASRRTFAYLIAILNASYPDHDFSTLEPTDFTRSSLKSFISKFESSLYSLGKQSEEWIWDIINPHMTLADCVVYLYSPAKSFLEDEPGYLWSLMGFLFNKKRKRVAFLYLISSRLQNAAHDINYDDNFAMDPKRKLTIDDDSNQFEGEYDLVNDEEAIIDDTEDDFLIGSRI